MKWPRASPTTAPGVQPTGLAWKRPSNVATLARHAAADRCLLVDCLTLWLSNLLIDAEGAAFERERDALLDTLPGLPGEILLVSNEVGCGVVPMGELSRRFVDEAGRLHQALAERCGRVVFVAAGLPLALKGSLP